MLVCYNVRYLLSEAAHLKEPRALVQTAVDSHENYTRNLNSIFLYNTYHPYITFFLFRYAFAM